MSRMSQSKRVTVRHNERPTEEMEEQREATEAGVKQEERLEYATWRMVNTLLSFRDELYLMG